MPCAPTGCRRLPTRLFATPDARWQAVAQRAGALRAGGRPVLIGTDTVADSERLSWHLHQAGVPHTVLNARHDAQEAAIVAEAGQAGRITVATRMAGRGTDIHLDATALAAGGLHVIDCQRNESRRMDRQLHGRCARQGQPGSVETWICAAISSDCAPLPASNLQACMPPSPAGLCARAPLFPPWSAWAARLRHRLWQWVQAQRQTALRAQLLAQDRQWEAQHRSARRPEVPRP